MKAGDLVILKDQDNIDWEMLARHRIYRIRDTKADVRLNYPGVFLDVIGWAPKYALAVIDPAEAEIKVKLLGWRSTDECAGLLSEADQRHSECECSAHSAADQKRLEGLPLGW